MSTLVALHALAPDALGILIVPTKPAVWCDERNGPELQWELQELIALPYTQVSLAAASPNDYR